MPRKRRPARTSKRYALQHEGYLDGYHGRPWRQAWGSGGADGHAYGMGYFQGRKDRLCQVGQVPLEGEQ